MTNSFLQLEDDLFYFESDHLALRGNKDYCEVLKTLFSICAQREKAIKDYGTVVQLKKDALSNPLEALDRYKTDRSMGVPSRITLSKIPQIDFKKFEVSVPLEEVNVIYSDLLESNVKEETKLKCDKTKQWTHEEQKRLEELLRIYPPEAVEAKRFQKIAKALGNRTAKQVSSRVQKYFLKLYKAGLPIPGRIPKSSEKYKKASFLHKHQRHNHYLWKPTTFFPELFVPVLMNDEENVPGPSLETPSSSSVDSSNYLVPTKYHQNDEFSTNKTETDLQLDILKRIKEVKLAESDESYVPFRHIGYMCDYCNVEPIEGTRWHCITCTYSVDFCTDCVLSQMYSETCHSLHHKLVVISHDNQISHSDSGSIKTTSSIKFESDLSDSEDNESSEEVPTIYQNGEIDKDDVDSDLQNLYRNENFNADDNESSMESGTDGDDLN